MEYNVWVYKYHIFKKNQKSYSFQSPTEFQTLSYTVENFFQCVENN